MKKGKYNERMNPYGNETTYTLAKIWLETHSYQDLFESSEYNWLCFYLGEYHALSWLEWYLELKEDDEIKKGVELYEKKIEVKK